jgi:exosortase/archaeosortase family protein
VTPSSDTTPIWPLETARSRLGFALRFLAVAAVLFAIYTFPYREAGLSEVWFERYLAVYARAAAAVLACLEKAIGTGVNVQVQGAVIGGRYPLEIVKNCDAIEINILFASAVLAFPASASQRAWGLALGLPLLVLLNLVRICTLYFIGVHAPERFETFHVEVWPLCLVAATTLLFLAYTSWTQHNAVRA